MVGEQRAQKFLYSLDTENQCIGIIRTDIQDLIPLSYILKEARKQEKEFITVRCIFRHPEV